MAFSLSFHLFSLSIPGIARLYKPRRYHIEFGNSKSTVIWVFTRNQGMNNQYLANLNHKKIWLLTTRKLTLGIGFKRHIDAPFSTKAEVDLHSTFFTGRPGIHQQKLVHYAVMPPCHNMHQHHCLPTSAPPWPLVTSFFVLSYVGPSHSWDLKLK